MGAYITFFYKIFAFFKYIINIINFHKILFKKKLKEDTDSLNHIICNLKIKEEKIDIISQSQNDINISYSNYSNYSWIEIPSEDGSQIEYEGYNFFIEQAEINNIITNKKEKNYKKKQTIPKNNNDKEKYYNKKTNGDNQGNNNGNDNNNENKENNNNVNNNKYNNNFRKYINEEIYPIVRNHLNINPSNINLVDVIGDGNCLFSSIARFVFGDENMHERVRNEKY